MQTILTKEHPPMTKLVRFDWAIKYLLRNKANFDILEGFLSELLKMPIHIESILESESNKEYGDDKFNRVDLLVRTDENQHIIIEVQCSRQWDYLSRILYGTSKVVCEQLHESDPYQKIRKVISVSIVFFNLGRGQDYLYRGSTTFKGLHCDDDLGLTEKEQAVYQTEFNSQIEQTPDRIFPEYYLIKVTKFQERVMNKLDEWIYFLKHGEIKHEFAAQGIQSAAQKLDILRLSEKERRIYEQYKTASHDDASFNEMLRVMKQEGIAKGKAEGEAIGEARGKAEGEAIGEVKGRLSVARSLKQAGLSPQQIAEYTGLSLADIREL